MADSGDLRGTKKLRHPLDFKTSNSFLVFEVLNSHAVKWGGFFWEAAALRNSQFANELEN
jgi:hypothetical protein